MTLKVIKGDSIEAQMLSIDRNLLALRSRISPIAKVIQSPVPIMLFCKEPDLEGYLFRGILPFTCTVSTVVVYLELTNKQRPATLGVTIGTEKAKTHTEILCSTAFTIMSPEGWKADIGSVIEFYLTPIESAKNIYVGIAVHPEVSSAKIYRVLLDELAVQQEAEQGEQQKLLDSAI